MNLYVNIKKERIKSLLIIALILIIAIFSTHYIYYKYKNESNVDYNSESLDIVFHEKSGGKVAITKVTPVTDSVGLSSTAYTFTVTNNLTEPVKYQIKLVDDKKTVKADQCGEYSIGKQYLKVSIKENGKDNKIFNLNELEEDELLSTTVDALKTKNYTVRVWVDKDVTIPYGSDLHYHGIIKVVEE